MKNTKRVSMTIESGPYIELQAIAKELGLDNRWLSREIDRLVKGLLPVFREIVEDSKRDQKMTEAEMLRFVVGSVEKAQGMRLKNILK